MEVVDVEAAQGRDGIVELTQGVTARQVALEDGAHEPTRRLHVGAVSLSKQHRRLDGGVPQLFTYQLIDRTLRPAYFAVPEAVDDAERPLAVNHAGRYGAGPWRSRLTRRRSLFG